MLTKSTLYEASSWLWESMCRTHIYIQQIKLTLWRMHDRVLGQYPGVIIRLSIRPERNVR